MSESVASHAKFKDFCAMLEQVSRAKGKDNKQKIMTKYIDQWREAHRRLHGDQSTDDSFFPVLRLILPQCDRERLAYGLKENKLAKHLIEVLCIAKQSADAQKLVNFRAPQNAKSGDGDFASIAYFVLKNRCSDDLTLHIEEINDRLDTIALNNARGKEGQPEVDRSLMHLIRNLSSLQLKWLIRIILKDMKGLGLTGEASVLPCFHPDAKDLYDFTTSLTKVCTLLKNREQRLHEIEIQLFSPFRPMLGERAKPGQIEKFLQGKEFFIEEKFDGERFQLHKDGDQFRYFSRNGHDYTDAFGADRHSGSFTPLIAACFNAGIESCILDGEMCGYSPSTGTIHSKGQNLDIKAAKDGDPIQPCLCVFDVLVINGRVLTNQPLKERVEQMAHVFTPRDGRMVHSKRLVARTNKEVLDALNDAIDARLEGIVIKNPLAPYKPNMRNGGGWYKVKPDYVLGLNDELDVLIVGGYFGSGRRGGMLSHFLCAVAVPNPSGGHPEQFATFCKVGTGYSLKELADFNAKLMDKWHPFDKKAPPEFLLLAGEKPEVWIEPKESVIVQIKATEIADSDKFKAGCTARFPTLDRFRDDKSWFDCMKLAELEELRQRAGGKLHSQHAELVDEDEHPEVKRRRRVAQPIAVAAQFRGADVSSVQQVSDSFRGKQLCIMATGADGVSKHELERKLAEMGGSFVQNPGSETYCVVADKEIARVKNVVRSGQCDVVKAGWLIRCTEAQRLLPWTPQDMLFASPKTKEAFARDYDRFGDSDTREIDEEQLRTLFATMDGLPELKRVRMDAERMAELEDEYFPARTLFRLCRVYPDWNARVNDPGTRIAGHSLELSVLQLRLWGATIVSSIDDATSHVLCFSGDTVREEQIKHLNRTRARKLRLVSELWVTNSIAASRLCE